MKKRDIPKLCATTFDLLVIGGGVHGATITCHAAKAGYHTALVEKNDFCGATSANSLKILHGGLRYLQHGNIKRMRHSIIARREMMQMAPYLVEPLPCIMPLCGRGLRGPVAMRTALFLNDCIGWDRNHGLPAALHLPKGHIVSTQKCREVIPGIATEALHGGAVWYDALAVNTERLVLEYILESCDYGAEAANYAQVTAVEKGDDGLYEVTILDRLSKQVHRMKTRCIVNAAGPWFEEILQPPGPGPEKKQQWALALNIVSRKKIFHEYAVALEGKSRYEDRDALIQRDRRLYFFVPWQGYTMIGTEYEASDAGPDSLRVSRETLQNMVDEVNAIYPPAQLNYEDLSFYHAGLLPMRSEAESDAVQLTKNSTFFVNHGDKCNRIVSVKGVKYTTAPWIAREITAYLKKHCQPSRLGGAPKEFSKNIEPRDGENIALYTSLAIKYGKRAMKILSLLPQPDDTRRDKASQLLRAEVRYLVTEEMACTLADIIFRRTALGSAECPQRDVLVQTAAFMGEILGWDEARRESEIDEVLLRYSPLVVPAS